MAKLTAAELALTRQVSAERLEELLIHLTRQVACRDRRKSGPRSGTSPAH